MAVRARFYRDGSSRGRRRAWPVAVVSWCCSRRPFETIPRSRPCFTMELQVGRVSRRLTQSRHLYCDRDPSSLFPSLSRRSTAPVPMPVSELHHVCEKQTIACVFDFRCISHAHHIYTANFFTAQASARAPPSSNLPLPQEARAVEEGIWSGARKLLLTFDNWI